jgi:orotidine-5'-phosphate decarboxylase
LADAVTVNPYLGRDSLDPFLAACRRDGAGLFCVVKTSNPGGGEVQDLVLSDGRHVWHQVAELVNEWGGDLIGEHGLSAVGAVVGATHPRAVGEARKLLPRSILLLPGVGAQGATPADVAPRLHERACERARQRRPQRHLCDSRLRNGLAHRCGREASKYARDVWSVSGW